jgi:hypothetical protein
MKKVKYLFNENYNSLKKEFKEEGQPMFLDWKNQYCENGYTTKSKLHAQCKIPMTLFIEIEKSILKFIQRHRGLCLCMLEVSHC